MFHTVVDEAFRHVLKPVGHVPESVPIEEAAVAGHRSCEHLFGFEKVTGRLLGERVTLETGGMAPDARFWVRLPEVDREELHSVVYRVRDSGMAVCPAIVVFKSGASMNEIPAGTYAMLEYVCPMIRGIWNMMWDPAQQDTQLAAQLWPQVQMFVHELHEVGMTLMVGTDLLFPGIIPGFPVHEEMVLWQEAVVPPPDVLRAVAIAPACLFGLDERLGTLDEGKVASLVPVKADPLEDIRNAGQIEGVFLRWRYLNHEDLARLLDEGRELSQSQDATGKDSLA